MMTLDEAIVHAREVAASLGDCSECAKDHIQLAEWLEELRELRDTDRWIPVSEKLPDDADWYLVTYIFKNRKEVATAFFSDDTKCFYKDACTSFENVTAWKPLPKSYESKNK